MNVCIRAKHLKLVSVLGRMLMSANVHAVKLEYADRSKKQKDITAISHSVDSGLGTKANYKFLPYNINKHWSPSVEVMLVSVDADPSKRESEFYSGVTYAF